MKLIIDIPDHIYSMVTNTGTFGCYRYNTSKAIRQGIPLEQIRAEIEALPKTYPFINHIDTYIKEDDVKRIIDKYKAERSDKEC